NILTEPICGHLEQNVYCWEEEYEALSYVWGDSSDASTIFIDDCESSVTRNLESALRYLR
ncbi:hypothetical protein BDZ45DRAFT_566428, partial [Acephala macrosclerotiorum]